MHAARERATQEERQRRAGEQRLELAQELHDVLAHHISLINVQAGVALHLMDEHPERVAPALTEIKHASREALHELRGALEILRHADGAPRAPAPGLAELDRLVATVATSGLDVRLTADDERGALPAAVELAAYRIVQEALTKNRSRTRAAPTPTNISTNSEPLRLKKGTFASPATARASSVLPVRAGPPAGRLWESVPPRFVYFFGVLRNSTISLSSSSASSTPATSRKAHLHVVLRVDLRAASRERHHAAFGAAHSAEEEAPDATTNSSGMSSRGPQAASG